MRKLKVYKRKTNSVRKIKNHLNKDELSNQLKMGDVQSAPLTETSLC